MSVGARSMTTNSPAMLFGGKVRRAGPEKGIDPQRSKASAAVHLREVVDGLADDHYH